VNCPFGDFRNSTPESKRRTKIAEMLFLYFQILSLRVCWSGKNPQPKSAAISATSADDPSAPSFETPGLGTILAQQKATLRGR
jgi:hypothetical protein